MDKPFALVIFGRGHQTGIEPVRLPSDYHDVYSIKFQTLRVKMRSIVTRTMPRIKFSIPPPIVLDRSTAKPKMDKPIKV